MAALPYIQLYAADYLADTIHLTLREHGAYLLLILNYWQRGEPLRDDPTRLAAICHCTFDEWAEIEPALIEFFEVSDGYWHHNRIDIDLQQVARQQNQRIAAGKASANARKRKEIPTVVQRSFNERRNGRSTNKDTDTDTDKHKEGRAKKSAPVDKSVDNLNINAWNEFTKYRVRSKIKKLQPASVIKQQKWLVEQGNQDIQQQIVEQTIRQGWQGLQTLKGKSNGQKSIGTTRNDRIEKVLAQDSDPGTGDPRGNVPLLGDSEKTGRE